jgi:hypothetical protein
MELENENKQLTESINQINERIALQDERAIIQDDLVNRLKIDNGR